MTRIDEAKICLEQAQIYWQAKQWQLTIEACTKVLALEPEIAIAHKLMGDALQKTGKFQDALNYYQQAIAIQPDFADVYINLGSLYANQKRWSEAMEHYQQALTIDPELIKVHQYIAKILRRQQSLVKVDTEAKFQPKPTLENYLSRAKTLQHQGKLKAALGQYQQAAKLAPQNVEIYREIVYICEQLELWQDAARYCRLIWQLTAPDALPQLNSATARQLEADSQSKASTAESYYQLGLDYSKQKQWQLAIAHYQKAIALDPQMVRAYLSLAKLLTAAGAESQAIACYIQGIKYIQNSPELYYHLGNLYHQAQKRSQAIVCYQKAIQYQPDNASAHHQLGEVFSQQQQWMNAIKSYRQAIQYNPDFSWSYNNLGYALIQVARWSEAVIAYQQAIKLDPDFAWSYYNLAEAYGKLGQWDCSIEFYQRAAKIQPDLPQIQQKLGDALYNRSQKDRQQALEHFMLAIKREPNDPKAYHQALAIDKTNLELYLKLGDILVQQGQIDRAIVIYQMALQIQPKNSTILARLNKVLEKKTLVTP